MNELDQLKINLQEIALKNAKQILLDSGFKKSDSFYSLRQYEMQFTIYNQLKLAHGILN